VIGDSSSDGASPVTVRHLLRMRIPGIAHAPIFAAAPIIVVQVAAAATLRIAGR